MDLIWGLVVLNIKQKGYMPTHIYSESQENTTGIDRLCAIMLFVVGGMTMFVAWRLPVLGGGWLATVAILLFGALIGWLMLPLGVKVCAAAGSLIGFVLGLGVKNFEELLMGVATAGFPLFLGFSAGFIFCLRRVKSDNTDKS